MAVNKREGDAASTRSYAAHKVKAPEVKPFRLLDLPPELRNQIYGLALVHSSKDDPLRITERAWIPHGRRQLLGVCRQIRREALPIYYCDNGFFTRTTEAELNGWLSAIGDDALRCLTSLKVEVSVDCRSYQDVTLQLEDTGVESKTEKKIMMRSIEHSPKGRGRCKKCCRSSKWVDRGTKLAQKLRVYGGVEATVELEEGFGRLCSRYEVE